MNTIWRYLLRSLAVTWPIHIGVGCLVASLWWERRIVWTDFLVIGLLIFLGLAWGACAVQTAWADELAREYLRRRQIPPAGGRRIETYNPSRN